MRALPSTYAEAEEAAKKPPQKPLGNGDSVSKYFMSENSYQAFISVREMEDWALFKDDPIFKELTDLSEVALLEDVIGHRDRPDLPVEEEDGEIVEERDENGHGPGWNVMDTVIQQLESNETATRDQKPTTSQTGPGPSTTGPVSNKDNSQEDILARLGVTGSPKPVYSTPGPAYAPPPPHLKTEMSGVQQTFASPVQPQPQFGFQAQGQPYGPPQPGYAPPPPPEREQSPMYDVWKSDQISRPNGHSHYDGARDSPRSENSQHTLVGSDFHEDAPANNGFNLPDESGPIPLSRSDTATSRKRSFDASEEQDEGKRRQYDDVTPRLKKRQPKVSAAYR